MYAKRVAELTVILALGAVSCSGPGEAENGTEGAPTAPVVTDARTDLILSWYLDGGPVTASAVDGVPGDLKTEVRVQDPTIPPERRDPDWIFLADLRRPGKDGRYPVRTLRREDYEAGRRETLAAAERARAQRAAETEGKPLDLVPNPGAKNAPVIMYANRHCPVCQKARRWLLDQKIPYVEKDIQVDQAAAAEVMAKGKAQGVPVSGVPIFDVGGRLIPGFDKDAIRKAIAAPKPAPATQGVI